MKVLLFDIDGTLILSGGAGSRSLTKAFKELYGVENAMDGIDAHGKTDPEIVREIFERKLSVEPSRDDIELVLRKYVEHLEHEVKVADGYRVLPGVREALEFFSREGGYLLGLATGNIEEGARIKLSRGDLWRFFEFGGFGSDSHVRWRIVAKAVERALKLLNDGDPDVIVVVGDTPRDVWAAHKANVKAVGVATGRFSSEELSRAGADAVLEDMSDLKKFLQILSDLES